VGSRARTRLRRWACRPSLASGGSERVAGCGRPLSGPRCRGVICRSPSGRRSRSCAPGGVGCGRSPVGSVARRRRSPGSFAATQQRAAAGSSIAPAPRNGMPIGVLSDRSRPSLLLTPSFGAMCRIASPALCSALTGLQSRVLRCGGSAGVTAGARTGAGRSRGARSRSLIVCGSTSRMMSRCGSRTRRSTSRCMCRAGVRSDAS
jgi:hypothetical protein